MISLLLVASTVSLFMIHFKRSANLLYKSWPQQQNSNYLRTEWPSLLNISFESSTLVLSLNFQPCSGIYLVFTGNVFRSRKKFSTTYAIVSFFSPDLFMKISNFSKTVNTIFIKFWTVILHPKGSLCALGIKIVWLECEKHSENQPKNGQKTVIFRLFSIFSKTVHTIRTKFSPVILHHIRVLSYMCVDDKLKQKQSRGIESCIDEVVIEMFEAN